MMILFRVFLIGLIVYLIVRSFTKYNKGDLTSHKPAPENKDSSGKKISKEIGEYIDYEELDK
jgi:hypothetical protein